MAAKHTPGPWGIEGHIRHPGSTEPSFIISHGTNAHGDGPAGRVGVFKGSEADARLIVAVPAMRKALLAVRAACRDPDTDTALPSSVGEAVEAALTLMGERS